jgi:hypothetical protein
VVARYKEDLGWLVGDQPDAGATQISSKMVPFKQLVVYNKGPIHAPAGCKDGVRADAGTGAAVESGSSNNAVTSDASSDASDCFLGEDELRRSLSTGALESAAQPKEVGNSLYRLPNVGREGHTYLHYIVQHYNSLPEHVVFLQGDPFDHARFGALDALILACLESHAESDSDSTDSDAGLRRLWSNSNSDYCTLSTEVSLSSREGYPHIPPILPLGELYDQLFDDGGARKNRKARAAASYSLFDERTSGGGSSLDRLFLFANGGQFMVSKRRILAHPLSFYERCLEKMATDGIDPVNGYLFERLWPAMFDGHSSHRIKGNSGGGLEVGAGAGGDFF